MSFLCRFEGPTTRPAASDISADPDVLESQDVAIIRACEILSTTDARFFVQGFGLDDWNLDVKYDLSIFLEQTSDVLMGLHARDDSQIDLYSQGVERILTFHPYEESVRIECLSGTSWKPDPSEEDITLDDLISMLSQLVTSFSQTVEGIDGHAARIEPFSSWLRGVLW